LVGVDGSLCGQCGGCVSICPYGAIYLSPSELRIDPDLCTMCGDCIEFCPVEALSLVDE
jgi:pyruvate formate lyase activating enzyme